jgi:hypothetical protein
MWGAHWTMYSERRGVPSVNIVDEPFIDDVRVTCDREGMSSMRRLNVMHPCGHIPDEQLPETISKLVDALTVPLTEEERKTGTVVPELSPRIALTGTLDEIQDYFHMHQWADGLPIVPPTEERVQAFLSKTSHSPDEVVTTRFWPEELTATVEKVAIVGVMAGCKPEYMPVLLAIVEAWGKGEFSAIVRSTGSFSFPVVVHGPIRNEIEMNSGIDAMGPCNQANATIGRFLRLAIISLGGSRLGINMMASLGNPTKCSFCFAENEERSPWEPFHVSMGYKPEESVVSVSGGGLSHVDGFVPTSKGLDRIARGMATFMLIGGVVVMLDPMLAIELAEKEGYTKQDAEEYIWSRATDTMGNIRSMVTYESMIEPILKGKVVGREDSWPAEYLDLPDDAVVQVYPRKGVKVMVVGGETNPAVQAWSFGFPSMVSVDKWR